MKQKISLLLILCLLATLFVDQKALARTGNLENLTEAQLDTILQNAKVPDEKLEDMDIELKRFIIETSGTDMEYVETVREDTVKTRAGEYEIPTSQLKLEVYAFRSGNILSIYPLYEWLVPIKPKGKDFFGYATSNSYSVRPGERSNIIWTKFINDTDWDDNGPATYTASSLYGYQHRGSTLGTPDAKLYFRGNFHYKVDIDSSNPIKKIALAYVHDTSSGGNYSYGISYGPASISITPTSTTNVGHQNGVFNLIYD